LCGNPAAASLCFAEEKKKAAVRRVRFLNRLNYELTFAQRLDIINLWSLPSAIDGKRSKTVACHPASAEWRRVYSLAGNFSRGGDTYYDYTSGCVLDRFHCLDALSGVGQVP